MAKESGNYSDSSAALPLLGLIFAKEGKNSLENSKCSAKTMQCPLDTLKNAELNLLPSSKTFLADGWLDASRETARSIDLFGGHAFGRLANAAMKEHWKVLCGKLRQEMPRCIHSRPSSSQRPSFGGASYHKRQAPWETIGLFLQMELAIPSSKTGSVGGLIVSPR